jgi:hypothetical protein
MNPSRGCVIAACAAIVVLAGCDVPIGTAPRDGKGAPVVESKDGAATVQVIVRLRLDAPEGAPPDSDAYRSAVAAVRADFLAQLGGVTHRVVRTYETMPLVVLAIAPVDRAAVEKLPTVASVEEDRLNAPLAQ